MQPLGIRSATPVLAFATFFAAGVALVPASATGSTLLIAACVLAVAASLAALITWVLLIDARARSAERSRNWDSFENGFRSYAARAAAHVHEHIHSFERPGDRPPLLVHVITDPDGAVLEAAAYDPDDYL